MCVAAALRGLGAGRRLPGALPGAVTYFHSSVGSGDPREPDTRARGTQLSAPRRAAACALTVPTPEVAWRRRAWFLTPGRTRSGCCSCEACRACGVCTAGTCWPPSTCHPSPSSATWAVSTAAHVAAACPAAGGARLSPSSPRALSTGGRRNVLGQRVLRAAVRPAVTAWSRRPRSEQRVGRSRGCQGDGRTCRVSRGPDPDPGCPGGTEDLGFWPAPGMGIVPPRMDAGRGHLRWMLRDWGAPLPSAGCWTASRRDPESSLAMLTSWWRHHAL